MDKPWSMQVELTEGCNRYCAFCGLRAIRSGPGVDLKFMSLELAGKVAQEVAHLAPTLRIEFAMHGEPTLHPNHLTIIAGFRKLLPSAQLQMTTNGKTLLKSFIPSVQRLLHAGLDFIALDTYTEERAALRAAAARLPAASIKVFDLYADENCPSPWNNHRRKLQRAVILIDDLGECSGQLVSRKITSQGGNSRLARGPEEPKRAMCTIPFREMSVCWNGNVCICCNDWSQEFVAGNVHTQSLASIWNGERMAAARRILFARRRDFAPCAKCDVGSGNRCGLVDPQEPPSDKDWEIVRTKYKENPHV